jgi:hypothetical protein
MLYLAVLYCSSITGWVKFKWLDISALLFLSLITYTALSESLIYVCYAFKNEKYVFIIHFIYGIVELILLTAYFISMIKKRDLLLYASVTACLWIGLSWIDYTFIHCRIPNNEYPVSTDQVLTTAKCVVGILFSLYSIYRILLNDPILNIRSYMHFWFWTIWLFYCCSTFFFWILRPNIHNPKYATIAQVTANSINIFLYLLVGLVFFNYRKDKTAQWMKDV